MATDDRTLRKGDSPKSRVLAVRPDATCCCRGGVYSVKANDLPIGETLARSAWDSWRRAEAILTNKQPEGGDDETV